MQCEHCGCEMDAADKFCPGCGKEPVQQVASEPVTLMQYWEPMETSTPATATEPPAASAPLPADPAPVARIPEPRPAAKMPTNAPPPPFRATPIPATTSGKATASLICGILFPFGFTAIAAVVLGHLALSEIKRSAGRLLGRGQAVAGLVLGYFGIAVPILLIVAAIALPNLLRSKQRVDQTAAISDLRIIVNAETAFEAKYPLVGYTCDLRKLQSEGLIDDPLASGNKSGYIFELSGCMASSSGMVHLYQLTATPADPGRSGQRAFCTDQSGEIRYDANGSAASCIADGTPIE